MLTKYYTYVKCLDKQNDKWYNVAIPATFAKRLMLADCATIDSYYNEYVGIDGLDYKLFLQIPGAFIIKR